MKKKSVSKTPSIVTIDVYGNLFFKVVGSKFSYLKKLKANKNDISIGYFANRDFNIAEVDVSINLPQEHLLDYVTDKVYEELRLDPAVEYEIHPVKTALIDDNIKYQVLISDSKFLKETFAPLAKSIRYIDYIVAQQLLFKVLYSEGKLKGKTTDLFIYFGEYDTFITFYNKGEYLYSKSINYSIEQIYDKFCKMAQDVPFSKEEFINRLSKEGFEGFDATQQSFLKNIFRQCFEEINDIVVNIIKNRYEKFRLEVGNVFLGFSIGYLYEIEEYVKTFIYSGDNCQPISSTYSDEDPKVLIDPMHALMAMSAKAMQAGMLELPNLTPFPKPAPLSKRPAGKILLATFVTTAIFLIPVVYDYAVGMSLQAKNTILKKKEMRLTAEANKYKNEIKKKKDELKALEKSLKQISNLYQNKKGELKNVYSQKFNYQLRSEQLALITNIIKGFDIQSRSIEINDTQYKIEVESKNDKEITAFIKKLVEKFNKKISYVDIKDITYDDKEKLYKGVLKVNFTESK